MAWLYCPNEDGPVDDLGSGPFELGDEDMLWVDVDVDRVNDVAHALDRMGLGSVTPKLNRAPSIERYDSHLELWVTTLGGESQPSTLHCVVGPNWVVTFHEDELNLVDDFNKPFIGETRLGELNGPAFLALVLDWQISSYIRVVEDLHGEIDQLDGELLTVSPDERELLTRLHELRSRVGGLRTTLSPHRDVFALLSNPRSTAVVGAIAADDYRRLEDRLHNAIDRVDTAREMIVGSFDIFMTRTAQKTNVIMKRLTIVSVLLLPGAVIAGVMGMNFEVGFFDWSWMFWIVVGAMAGLATGTLFLAKRRGWV